MPRRKRKPYPRPIVPTPSGYRPLPGIIIRDKRGRFMPWSQLYSKKVANVSVWRGQRYIIVLDPGLYPDSSDHTITPEHVATVTIPPEFDRLPEYVKPVKEYKSTKKYQAWDVAQQIDKTKGLRRKLLKITMQVKTAGGRLRKIETYTRIRATQKRSYQVFMAMNKAIGAASMFLYDRVGGKLLAERTGKKVRLMKVKVEQVI